MRKGLLLVMLMVGFMFVGTTEAATVRMKAAHYFDDAHAWNMGFLKFKEIIEARSNKSLELTIYNRGVLGSEKDYVQNLMEGALDLSAVSTSSAGTLAPEMNFLDVPFIFDDPDHWRRAMDGAAGKRIAEVIERATASGDKPGLRILGYWAGTNYRHVLSRKRGYSTLSELAGMKLRLRESAPQIEMWKLLGVIPAVVAYQETYSAIQTGVVDGLENEMVHAFNMKFYEVAPHVTMTGHAISVVPFIMSGQTWKKLTPQQQQIVVEAAAQATEVARRLEHEQDEEAANLMRTKFGVKFYPFNERQQMIEKTKIVRQRIATELKITDVFELIDAAKKR